MTLPSVNKTQHMALTSGKKTDGQVALHIGPLKKLKYRCKEVKEE
jgi:hypothetical protein